MALSYDVVIVGAGPTGLTTALLLQKLGHNVCVLERHAQRYPQPRAIGILHQGMRIYGGLGVLDQMFESGAIQDMRGRINDNFTYIDGEGNVLAHMPLNMPFAKSGTAYSYSMHQPSLEDELEKACQQRGIQIYRSAEVQNVVYIDDHMEVTYFEAGPDGQASGSGVKLVAQFVVGCDGANSVVRKSSNIKFNPFQGPGSRWLVVDVIPIAPGSGAQWKDSTHAKQYLDPKRPRTSAPSPTERKRWEFMIMPEESSELALSDSFVWDMLATFNCGPDAAIVERRAIHSVTAGWVDTMAQGRTLLAGDAAHLAPQFLGQGLNSGLRDAKSLAWRLDLAIRCPESNWSRLLQDYSNEQLGMARLFVAAACQIEKMLTITDPEQAKARNALISGGPLSLPDLESVSKPDLISLGNKKYTLSCRPGALFIHDRVELGEKKGSFDNIVGEGWVLIALGDHDPLDTLTDETRQRYTQLFAGRSARFSETVGGNCVDLSGRYVQWFQENHVEAVLVRPDYYVYDVAGTRDEIEGMVKNALNYLC